MSPRTPLLRPLEYFETRPDPLGSGLVVFGIYVLGMAVFIYAVLRLFMAQIENLPTEGQRAFSRVLPEVLGTFVGLFVVLSVIALAVVAAIMHYGSGGPETAGTYGDAIAVAGWAYAPNLLALPVQYLLAWYDARSLTLDGSDPQVLSAQVEALQQPTGPGEILVTLLVVVWSVYILARGTAGTHEIDDARTILPALLVGIGSFLMSLL